MLGEVYSNCTIVEEDKKSISQSQKGRSGKKINKQYSNTIQKKKTYKKQNKKQKNLHLGIA